MARKRRGRASGMNGGAGVMNGGAPIMPREPCTFYLDTDLVERVRGEVAETDVVRSIEAALVAALDYQLWVREVRSGRRDPLG